MSSLADIQKTLNSSDAERRKFLANPIPYLEGQGVVLTAQDKENIQKVIVETPHLLNNAISVGVTVGT